MTSPAKTVRRLDAHIPRGIPRVLQGGIFRDNEFRDDDIFDNASEQASLFDGEDKPEQFRADQFRRVQFVAECVWNKRRFDGLTRRFLQQVPVRQFSAPSFREPSHLHTSYAGSFSRVSANISQAVNRESRISDESIRRAA